MAAILSLALVVFLYAVVRVIQGVLFPEPNPALVVWSVRIGMFWRIGVVVYASLLVAPLAFRWARRDLLGACRGALWGVSAAALAIALQAAVFP